ncbi:MAG: urease accessory protein UreD [Aeriscardovia sp.]|nr:urease accessory protein UreD [Aeriscardovia sp.]
MTLKTYIPSNDGYTEIEFTLQGGRTIASKRITKGQSRLSAPLHLNAEDTLVLFLITMGGGLVEGEHYKTFITSRENTHAIVASQAPTYVFKCNDGKTTFQDVKVKVEKGAELEYLPDDVIPYGNSKYKQTTQIDVEKGASLLYTDGVTAGWSMNHKDFQYRYAHMISRISYDGQLLFNDNLILDPHAFEMAEIGLFEGYKNYSSLVVVDERVDAKLVKELQDLNSRSFPGAIMGISLLEGPGMVVRVLGESINGNRAILYKSIDWLRSKFYGLPHLDLRKDVSFINSLNAIR